MELTDVKIKLVEDRTDKLLAFCTITIDHDFVIRDLKIIEGPKGAFVAMPSRKLTDRCPRCGSKNHRLAKFCNACGGRLSEPRTRKGEGGRARLHADIAHPITSECREVVQRRILDTFEAERERAKQEGYVPPDLDEDFVEEVETAGAKGRSKVPDPPQRSEEKEPGQEEQRPPPSSPSRREREPAQVEQRPPPSPPSRKEEKEPDEREHKPPPPLPSGQDSEDNFSSGIFR